MTPLQWPNRPSDWPSYMRPTIELYGGDRVYRLGLDALGYPPTWNPSLDELATIERLLKDED